MAKLKDRIKTAMDEGRILILGSQILVGFQMRAFMEPGFEKMPESSHYLKLVSICLMLLTTGLLMSPGAYHRIVAEGEDTEEVHSFTTRVLGLALLPFALALGIDVYIITRHLAGYTLGFALGVPLCLLALFFWYGLEMIRKSKRDHLMEERAMGNKGQEKEQKDEPESGGAKLKDKINQALTECRMVLPGAQALLGFQLIGVISSSFEKLPNSSKYVHLVSLLLMAVAVILLMAPAAYHRIVEEGEDTEHFHRTASRFLIAAMIPLALGITGDLFVVVRKVTESTAAASITAGLMLLFFYGLWFGFTIYRRSQHEPSERAAVKSRGQQFAS